ncbi:hypothetical protein M9Y10_044632 [Tritrichomonas musculus]|uniref:Tetraspanin family protein n=1 Tax=Tritrichomonas musculus TaxID=1915356 RepID=A0ABR2JT70_9EUKA
MKIRFNNQYIILAMTSLLFCIGTLIGGLIIQLKIDKKIIPSMITYIPFIMFMVFYIIALCVHLISSLYFFFKTNWFLSLTIFLRLISIVVGLFAIYLNYSQKDNLIIKIENIWFKDSYQLIVSYYQDYFDCCGWNTTTATCSYTRCYDFVNKQIDEISRLIGITVFVINTFQVGLCVDSILTIALHIESNSNKEENFKKGIKSSQSQNTAHTNIQEKDKNASNIPLNGENNLETSLSIDIGQNQQKEDENKTTFIQPSEDDNLINSNDYMIISDNSSNTLNTSNVLRETIVDRNHHKHKSKKPKDSRKKASNMQETEELINSHDYT